MCCMRDQLQSVSDIPTCSREMLQTLLVMFSKSSVLWMSELRRSRNSVTSLSIAAKYWPQMACAKCSESGRLKYSTSPSLNVSHASMVLDNRCVNCRSIRIVHLNPFCCVISKSVVPTISPLVNEYIYTCLSVSKYHDAIGPTYAWFDLPKQFKHSVAPFLFHLLHSTRECSQEVLSRIP